MKPNKYDVIVVGAGMFGSAAARHLSAAGARALVIGPAEPPPGVAVDAKSFGAYFDEARIARRLGWDSVWGTLDANSVTRFRNIEAASGDEFFRECGSLVLMDCGIAARTESMLQRCRNEGIGVERLTRADLRRSFAALEPPPLAGGVEGLFEPALAGYLNPRRLVSAQLRLAQRAGAMLHRGVVTALWKDVASREWQVRVRGADAVEASAPRIVLATGAITKHGGLFPLGNELALQAFSEPNLLFELDEEDKERLDSLPTIVTVDPEDTGIDNMSIYLLPPIRYPDGRWYVRIGPGMQPFVHEFGLEADMAHWYSNQRVTSQQAAFLTHMQALLLPRLKPRAVREACCIVEKTPSRYPYIGHLREDPTITALVGGNGHGARGSDEIGRLGARIALGLPWDSPIPQETFAPILACDASESGRANYLKPPFGLC